MELPVLILQVLDRYEPLPTAHRTWRVRWTVQGRAGGLQARTCSCEALCARSVRPGAFRERLRELVAVIAAGASRRVLELVEAMRCT